MENFSNKTRRKIILIVALKRYSLIIYLILSYIIGRIFSKVLIGSVDIPTREVLANIILHLLYLILGALVIGGTIVILSFSIVIILSIDLFIENIIKKRHELFQKLKKTYKEIPRMLKLMVIGILKLPKKLFYLLKNERKVFSDLVKKEEEKEYEKLYQKQCEEEEQEEYFDEEDY